MTSTTAPVPTQEPERNEPPFSPAILEEMLKLLVKSVRAHQLYLPNNPIHINALEAVRAAFTPIWDRVDEFALGFTETAIRWEGQVVLDEPTKSGDSLPWLFFKDGIREIRIIRGFEQHELRALLDLIQRARKASPEEDDLLTMLWEQDFEFLRYQYVDLALEQAPSIEGEPVPPDARVDAAAIQEEVQQSLDRTGVVSLDDFDATLYFLDEKEIEYLRDAVALEYQVDLRRNVLATLFDIFEQQGDPQIRDEVCTILDNLMLHLLSAMQFSAVAYLLREATATAQKVQNLVPAHTVRLAALPDRLSAPEALSQLLQSLDEAAELPPQDELGELFQYLRGSALGTILSWLSRAQNPRVRILVEQAAERLAAGNTGELVKLILSPDRAVALEAIRRAGALRTAAASAPLAKVMGGPDAQLRLAAVQALGEIGSPTALQGLEKAVDDPDRDVRIATVRALAARAHRTALPRIEAVVKAKAIRDADLTEKMAVFEAYGTLCGDAGVPVLADMLNGKGFLGRREDPELRACAAMALGRIGSARAVEALRQASTEKEILVRNAVNRALRGGAA